MDVALTLAHLVPGAVYSGSLTANTKAAFDALDWSDERPKPTWSAMGAASASAAVDYAAAQMVSKRTIVDRIIAAGKAAEFVEAKALAPDILLRWDAVAGFPAGDTGLRAVITLSGADPDKVLAV